MLPLGVREYEIVGEQGNQIRLTVFRAYGFMGRENLLYRPGRASGERTMETPDAQLIKPMTYKIGFCTFTGSVDQGGAMTESLSFTNTPSSSTDD